MGSQHQARAVRAALLASCAVAALLAVPASSNADDYVIDTAEVTTNGGYTIIGGDSLTITSSGSIILNDIGVYGNGDFIVITNHGAIATQGDDHDGIYLTGANGAIITNSGTIETQGDRAYGILIVGNDGRITNSGTITTDGFEADGINLTGANGSITNSGSVTTHDASSIGLYIDGANGSITNSGTVTTHDANSYGLYLIGDYGSITNSGTVTTHDASSIGLYIDGDNGSITNTGIVTTYGGSSMGIYLNGSSGSVTNRGTVITHGDGAHGIGVDAAVVNSGSIFTHGDDAHGITISGRGSIDHSGVIITTGVGAVATAALNGEFVTITISGLAVSERYDSVRFGYDATLNLQAPAFLGGEIDMTPVINADSTVAVNITTGASHSVLWDFSTGDMTDGAPTVTGPVEGFFNDTTKQFATFDPSGLAGAVERLADLTGQLAQLGRSAVAGGAAPGYGADLDASDEEQGAGFWAAPFGGSFTHDTDADRLLERDIEQYGVAAGYVFDAAPGLRLGVTGGYAATSLDTSSRFADSHDIDATGGFASLDGIYASGPWRFGFGVNGGWMNYDASRFINDNLAQDDDGATRGNSWGHADYDSWFVSPSASVGYQVTGLAPGWTFTPVLRGRYGYEAIAGYNESGAWTDGSNARVGDRNIGFLEGAVELVAEKSFAVADTTGTVNARAGWLTRQSSGDEAVPVTLIGIEQDVAFGDTNADAFYAGLGARFDAGAGELSLDGQAWFGDDMSGYAGMVRYTIRR